MKEQNINFIHSLLHQGYHHKVQVITKKSVTEDWDGVVLGKEQLNENVFTIYITATLTSFHLATVT